MLETDDLIFEVTSTIGNKRATLIKERIRLCLQPKPKWMPFFVWRHLIKRLIVIKHFK